MGEYFSPFLYPPISLVIFSPFTFFNIEIAGKLFTLLSILSYFGSIYLLFRVCRQSLFSTTGLIITIMLLNFFPAKFTLGMGQVNNFILLLVASSIYFAFKNEKISGILLSISIALKIFPVLFVPYIMLLKKWKILFYGLIFIFFSSISTYFFIDGKIVYDYFTRVLPSISISVKDTYYNQSIVGFLAAFVSAEYINVYRLLAGILLGGIASYFVIRYGRKKIALSFSLLIVLSLIFNTFTWQHHLVWGIVPLLVSLFYIKANKMEVGYYLVWSVIFLLLAINIKNPYDYHFLLRQHSFYGLIMLYLLNIYLYQRKGIDLISSKV